MTDQHGPLGQEHTPIKTIFIVEDDIDIGEMIVHAVQQETPYQAVLATDGTQARKRLRSITPHVLVLDYYLPGGINGLTLYDQLHATPGLEEIPALFMSANIPKEELKKRQVIYIEKPFELEELLQAIKKLLVE